MKILMLTPYLPYPLFSGGQVRSYNIIKELSKKHDVTLFAAIRKEEEKKYIPKLLHFCNKVATFDRGRPFSIPHVLLSGITLLPFILAVYRMPKLQKAIDEELQKNHYDIVHVETFYLMHNLPKTNTPVALFEQNIEYDVYRKFAASQPVILRPFLFLDIFKMKKWEEYYWKKANVLVVMSEADKKFVNKNAVVCGNGVDIEKFKLKSEELRVNEEMRVLFIGNFKWMENRDAVAWILKEIWPAFVKTSAGKPKTNLWVVGKNIPESLKQLTNDESIIFDENAPEDTAEIFQRADVLLAPIRVGGGTSFKILEAMASGVPVVTTSLGAMGIGAGDREEVLVADSAEILAKNVSEVSQDEKLAGKLRVNARKFVEQNYDWKMLVEKIEKIYQSVI